MTYPVNTAQDPLPAQVRTMPAAASASDADVLFTYYLKRRDGERPLGIVCAFVVLMTLSLIRMALPAHDWRPVAFYSLFCGLALAAGITLALQWRNQRVLAAGRGLLFYDWLGRQSFYDWSQITRAVEKRRPHNLRLVLEIGSIRTLVFHADFAGYPELAAACRERLRSVGQDIDVDELTPEG